MRAVFNRNGLWVLKFALCVLLLIMAGVAYFSLVQHYEKRVGGYSTAILTIAINMHARAFHQHPDMLHVLEIAQDTEEGQSHPEHGIMLHSIRLDSTYRNGSYDQAVRTLIGSYNYITLGQACYLALKGENSPRIRYVLKHAERLYRDSYESQLLEALPAFRRGDLGAKTLFEQVLNDVTSGNSLLHQRHWQFITSETEKWDTKVSH